MFSSTSLHTAFRWLTACICAFLTMLPAQATNLRATENFRREFKHLSYLSTEELINKGYEYISREKVAPDSAMMCFIVVIDRQEKSEGNPEEMENITMGFIDYAYVEQHFYNDISSAYRALKQGEEICLRYGFDKKLAHLYMNMGALIISNSDITVNNNTKSRKSALDCLQKAYRFAMKSNDSFLADLAIYNIMDCSFPSDTTLMRRYCRLYLDVPRKHTSPMCRYIESMCRGIAAYMDADYEGALARFNEMKKPDGFQAMQRTILDIQKEYYIGATYEAMGNLATAEKVFENITQNEGFMHVPTSRLWIWGKLYEFYRNHGDSAVADRYLLKYYREKDVMTLSNGGDNINEVMIKAELSKFSSDLLKSREKEKRTRLFVTAVVIISLLIITGLVMTLAYQRRQRRYIMSLYNKSIQLIEVEDRRMAETAPQPAEQIETHAVESSHPHTEETAPDADNEVEPVQSPSSTSREEDELLARIERVMSDRSAIVNPDFQLPQLCDAVDSNSTYVSRAINTRLGKNFKTLLTERRIAEACRLMNDPENARRLSIEGIAAEVGFKSRTTFSVAFKAVTGLTPSEFRSAADKAR